MKNSLANFVNLEARLAEDSILRQMLDIKQPTFAHAMTDTFHSNTVLF